MLGLLVIIRGESFRVWSKTRLGQNDRTVECSANTTALQAASSRTHVQLLERLNTAFSITLALRTYDLRAPMCRISTLYDAWNPQVVFHSRENTTQQTMWISSLKSFEPFVGYAAALILRFDLQFHEPHRVAATLLETPLNDTLVLAFRMACIRTAPCIPPYRIRPVRGKWPSFPAHTPKDRDRVADTFHWIPQSLLRALVRNTFAGGFQDAGHGILDRIPVGKVSVRYLSNGRYDSNTAEYANPIYSLNTRPPAVLSASEHSCPLFCNRTHQAISSQSQN